MSDGNSPDFRKSRRRKAIAEKMGFDAYGQHGQMPDPVAHAIDCILDHMHLIDQKMEQMDIAMSKAGLSVEGSGVPAMELTRLDEGGIVCQSDLKSVDITDKNQSAE